MGLGPGARSSKGVGRVKRAERGRRGERMGGKSDGPEDIGHHCGECTSGTGATEQEKMKLTLALASPMSPCRVKVHAEWALMPPPPLLLRLLPPPVALSETREKTSVQATNDSALSISRATRALLLVGQYSCTGGGEAVRLRPALGLTPKRGADAGRAPGGGREALLGRGGSSPGVGGSGLIVGRKVYAAICSCSRSARSCSRAW